MVARLALPFVCGVLLVAGFAQAQCAPSCAGGGGPTATDCFLAFAGAPGSAITCADGDACDTDGVIDGTCTFALAACTNAAVAGCGPTPLDAPPTATIKGTGAEAFGRQGHMEIEYEKFMPEEAQ